MKIQPDKTVLDKDYLKKKLQNALRKLAIVIAFVAVYFFFVKLLFL